MKITLNGHRITVRKEHQTGVAYRAHGEFEIPRFLLPAIMRRTRCHGYIGTASIALRGIFPKAKLIVIEPSDDNLQILKRTYQAAEEIVHGALVGTSEKNIALKNRGLRVWLYSGRGAKR